MRLMALMLIALSVICCKGRDDVAFDAFVTVTVNTDDITSAIPLSKVVSGVDYVFLETEDDAIISSIDKVVFNNDNYFVLDSEISQGVFCFNKKGEFLFKVGDIGRGPEELLKITDFSVCGENIYLYDSKAKKINVYSMHGEFVKIIPLNISGAELNWVNGEFLVYADFIPNPEHQKGSNLYNLYAFEKDGTISNLYLPYSNKTRTELITSNINYTFQSDSGSLLIYEPYSERLYRYLDGSPKPAYLIDFGGQNNDLSMELREKILTDLSQSFERVSQWIHDSKYCDLIMFAENKAVFFFAWKKHDNFYYTYYFRESGEVISAVRSRSDAMITGNPLPIDNDIDSVMYMSVVGAIGESMISWTHASLMPKTMGSSISDTDNPVLCIMNFKKQ